MICSWRSSTRFLCSRQLQIDRDEHLLASLCELGRQLDPVPQHTAAAACSLFSAAVARPEMQLAQQPTSTRCHVNQGELVSGRRRRDRDDDLCGEDVIGDDDSTSIHLGPMTSAPTGPPDAYARDAQQPHVSFD